MGLGGGPSNGPKGVYEPFRVSVRPMDREPGRRYQTAADLAADLQRFIDDEPIQARRASVAERSWRWCKRARR